MRICGRELPGRFRIYVRGYRREWEDEGWTIRSLEDAKNGSLRTIKDEVELDEQDGDKHRYGAVELIVELVPRAVTKVGRDGIVEVINLAEDEI